MKKTAPRLLPSKLLTFKAKALIALGVLQFIGLLSLGLLVYDESRQRLEDLALDKLSLEMERVSVDLRQYVRNETRMVRMLADLPHLRTLTRLRQEAAAYPEGQILGEMWTRQLQQIFLSTAANHPQCLELAFLDQTGHYFVQVRVEGDRPQSLFGGPVSAAAAPHAQALAGLDAGRVYISALQHSDSGPSFWMGMPVFDDSGRRGAVLLHVDPGEVLTRIHSPLEKGRAFLVDQQGTLYYHSDWTALTTDADPPALQDLHPRLAQALAGSGDGANYAACELEAHDGQEAHYCMHGFTKIHYDPQDDGRYWAVVFDAPPAVVFAPLTDLRDRLILLGSVVVVFSLGMTLLFSQQAVVGPVLRLEAAARRVAAGDLHLKPMPDAAREDEIGRLYASFQTMVEKLRLATDHLQEQIQARTAELQRSEAELEKRNADLQRLSAYKSQLLSLVSHELKTPLTSIDGFSRTIKQIFLSDAFLDRFDGHGREILDKVRHRVGVIGDNSARLSRLVDDLLDFSRIDRGQGLEINPMRVDAGRLLRETLELYTERAAAKGLELRYEGSLQPRDLWITADEGRIRQVLNNLLDNALKFTDSGTIRLQAAYEGDLLRIDVKDDGIGIEADALERIFELFEQAGDSTVRRQGTGVGLALGRYIAVRHGGYLQAASDGPGKGSCFSLGLPLHGAERAVPGIAAGDAGHRS